MQKFKRFNFAKKPKRTMFILRPVAKLLFKPPFKKHHTIVRYHNGVENLKPPFILLGNHNAYLDFSVIAHCIKYHPCNFVVAIDGFIGREGLLRGLGCIGKRKFTKDILLIRHVKDVLDRGDIPVIYPEARYSLCGTTALLPESIGKMIKLFKVPVVTVICHGNHINQPFYDTSCERGIDHNEGDFYLLFTKEDIEKLSVDEINERLVENFQYDEYKWQKDNKIKITYPNRCDGLEKVLYKCPHCGTEFEMKFKGNKLYCDHCHKEWEMDEYGEMHALEGKTEFSHIPDWYEWERKCVREEIEKGTYTTGKLKCKIESLPNAKKFIDIGEGYFIQDMNGIRCEINDKTKSDTTEIVQAADENYGVHIEYRYLFTHGDCIDLNTMDDTWYVYPEGRFNVTKISLATEELYLYNKRLKGLPIKKGLA